MVMPLNVFNLDSYAVECLRHNHPTWKTVDCLMVMPKTVDCLRHNHLTWIVMLWMSSAQPFILDVYAVECLQRKHLTVFRITIQLGWLCRWMSSTWIVMPLNVFNLDSYAVECLRHNYSTLKTVHCLRHNHSTWMVMPLNGFNLDSYAVECLRYNH
jgi:hypothetical protein